MPTHGRLFRPARLGLPYRGRDGYASRPDCLVRVPDELRAQSPAVEWRKIAGLRDIVAHEYFGISIEIVWDILQNKLPGLRLEVAKMLEEQS